MFVDRPGEFVIKLPCHERHGNCTHRYHAWNRDQKWFNSNPDSLIYLACYVESVYGIVNLIHLDCCIDQKRKIVRANSDDLNGIL